MYQVKTLQGGSWHLNLCWAEGLPIFVFVRENHIMCFRYIDR